MKILVMNQYFPNIFFTSTRLRTPQHVLLDTICYLPLYDPIHLLVIIIPNIYFQRVCGKVGNLYLNSLCTNVVRYVCQLTSGLKKD